MESAIFLREKKTIIRCNEHDAVQSRRTAAQITALSLSTAAAAGAAARTNPSSADGKAPKEPGAGTWEPTHCGRLPPAARESQGGCRAGPFVASELQSRPPGIAEDGMKHCLPSFSCLAELETHCFPSTFFLAYFRRPQILFWELSRPWRPRPLHHGGAVFCCALTHGRPPMITVSNIRFPFQKAYANLRNRRHLHRHSVLAHRGRLK